MLASISTTSSVPSHLTPPLSPCVGPRALPEPKAAPQPKGLAPSPPLSSGAIDCAGEVRLSVVCPPRYNSAPGTMSGRCTRGPQMLPVDMFPRAVQSPAVAGSATPHTTRHVDLNVVCPRPPLWATSCQVMPHCSGQHLYAARPLGSRQ
jgi:hypothetical protein